MDNTSKSVENVKEVNEFQKIINDDETIQKLDDLAKKLNIQIAIAMSALAKGEVKEEERETVLKQIDESRRLVVDCIGMHHDMVMALYAKYVGDDSETSALHNRYW